ncbi:MAG: hypothetical protein JWM93_209 [Frankiales bacterium]|nr:hypothetical protein [Frankiales bacterium]
MSVVVAHAHRFPWRRRLVAAVVAAIMTACAIVAFGAADARAKDGWVASGDLPGTFSDPAKIAVDDATGNVLVADTGLHQVQAWGPGGAASTQLTTFALSAPSGLAINQSNGDVYVSNSARDEVQTFSVIGADSGTYTLTFNGQTTAPIAFDADAATIQAALEALSNIAPGDVLVDAFSGSGTITFTGAYTHTNVPQVTANGAGLHDDPTAGPASATTDTLQIAGVDEIARFSPDDRANPTTYTRDPSFVSPPPGSNPSAGQIASFASPLAVDPATGNVLVADVASNQVLRFDASGGFLGNFNGAASQGGAFQNLQDIVVGGGVTYVIDATGPYDGLGSMSGTSRVERFTSAGAPLGSLGNGDGGMARARDLAYGAASNTVFVVEQGGTPVGRLHSYQNGVELQVVDYDVGPGSANQRSSLAGVAVDDGSPTASGRVYGTRSLSGFGGFQGVQVFDRHLRPDVTLDAPSSIGKRSAHLSGTVDPILGTAVSHFELSTDAGQNWSPVTTTDDTATAPVAGHPQADLTGLDPNSSYQVRLVADNGDVLGPVVSPARTFRTLGDSPAVDSEQVTDRGPSSATLRAKITPFGLSSTYHFEYGLTDGYGSRAPVASERVAGSGQGALAVMQEIQGLQPGTTYHFRIVAHNAAGDTVGSDHTFATPKASSARAFELVSPAAKGGNNVRAQLGMQASAVGDAFSYVSTVVLGGLSEGAPLYPRYVASRETVKGAPAWVNRAVDPPWGTNQTGTGAVKLTFGVSDDGTKAVVMSLKKLAPGAVENAANVYLRDVATGEYTTMATSTDVGWFGGEVYTLSYLFVQGTPNFDHVLLYARGTSFLPGVPNNSLYDFTGGQLRVVSRDAAGVPIGGSGDRAGMSLLDHGRNVISADGARIVFWSDNGVYLRTGGVSRLLSASRRTSDAGTMQHATLIGGDRQLDHVYFFSKNLTNASVPDQVNLYRYDTEDDTLHLLTRASDSPNAVDSDIDLVYLQASADGSTVYFASQAALTPDATATGAPNVYVWRNGSLSLIAKLDGTYDHGGVAGAQFFWSSPNGRYFAMSLATKVTDYDPLNPACQDGGIGVTGSCHQVYRYDADAKSLICVSCPPDGHKAGTAAYLMQTISDVGTHAFARAVDDAGQVFFGSVEQLVAKDINSTWDVYEYDGQQTQLISTGRGSGARLGDVSEDGRDVFFTTQDRLVATDTDDSADVYDARIGGGIPAQNAVSPSTACNGQDCRGSGGDAAPSAPPAASETTTSGASRPTFPSKAKISKLTAGFKGTVLHLTLTVSGPGTIRVAGPKVVAVKRAATKAGSYRLTVKLTSKQRALRRKGRSVKAAMTVSFTPVFGKAVKTKLTRTAAR